MTKLPNQAIAAMFPVVSAAPILHSLAQGQAAQKLPCEAPAICVCSLRSNCQPAAPHRRSLDSQRRLRNGLTSHAPAETDIAVPPDEQARLRRLNYGS